MQDLKCILFGGMNIISQLMKYEYKQTMILFPSSSANKLKLYKLISELCF